MAAVNAASAWAQDKGAVNPKPLPPLANPNDPKIGAKELFGRKVLPAAMPTRVYGFYAHGCIAGAEGLPINGDNWQVMRLSRNRYWGHPDLVALVKRLAARARKDAGWHGILVGDMSQPRGGPMFTGHASHQVGLDADTRARVLCPWLHCGRGRTADQRRQLAGDAAIAQSLLGTSRSGRAGQAARCQGAQGRRLAGHPGRRHVATAWRADVYRARQPSGRARRRHLADTDADPTIVA